MTKEAALLRMANRMAQMARLCLLDAPDVIIREQERLIDEAARWIDNPPADIPD